jgi:hypothetical protein
MGPTADLDSLEKRYIALARDRTDSSLLGYGLEGHYPGRAELYHKLRRKHHL